MPVLLVNSQKRPGELVVASLRNLSSFLVELQLLSSKAARLPAVRSSGKNWLRGEQRWPGAVCVCVCVCVCGGGREVSGPSGQTHQPILGTSGLWGVHSMCCEVHPCYCGSPFKTA